LDDDGNCRNQAIALINAVIAAKSERTEQKGAGPSFPGNFTIAVNLRCWNGLRASLAVSYTKWRKMVVKGQKGAKLG
jgi:hypothetical protein